jgi:uncharacterized protein YgiM (DUF1202 family)
MCYGHVRLDAEPQPGFGPFDFVQPGDKINVTGIQSLRVSAMNPLTGDWGVAMLHVQANLPNAVPGQNVTLLVLGDVQIENQVSAQIPIPLTVTARANVNIRQSPTLDAFVMGTLQSGQTVTARGRLADSSWVYIDVPNQSSVGWVYAPSVASTSGIQTLNIVSPDRAYFAPMQAFYIQTGENDDPSCAEVPENGVMIQTSEGVAQVDLWINEVRIRLGSTAFIQAQRSKKMTITMLEGESHVQAKGVEYSASAGTQLTIPMDQNLAPSAPPNPPSPITNTNISNLPVQNLDRQVILPTLEPSSTPTTPATPTDIASDTPTNTNTSLPTPTLSETPTLMSTGTETSVPSDTPTVTPVPTQLPPETETSIPSNTPTATPVSTTEPTPPTDIYVDATNPPATATWTDIPTTPQI